MHCFQCNVCISTWWETSIVVTNDCKNTTGRPLHHIYLTKRTKRHSWPPSGSSASRRPQSSLPRCSHYWAQGRCHLRLGKNVAPTWDGSWKVYPLGYHDITITSIFSRDAAKNFHQQSNPTTQKPPILPSTPPLQLQMDQSFPTNFASVTNPLVEAPVLHPFLKHPSNKVVPRTLTLVEG